MRGVESGDTGWWQIEPPEDGPDPPEYLPPDDLDELYGGRPVFDTSGVEFLDGTQPHPMFENVRVIEREGGLSFKVPERFLDTHNAGKWAFEISGGRQWFKDRDDFGRVRYTESGISVWIPHLFPFEETNANGLPLILDRERCEVMVSLKQVVGFVDIATTAAVKTPFGELLARESALSYNPEHTRYFDEFEFTGKPLVADAVTYPPQRWLGPEHYLREMHPELGLVTRLDMLLGRLPFPEEFYAQHQPNDWQERKPSHLTGTALGTMWVPVDELRRGVEAEISFPCFYNPPIIPPEVPFSLD